MKILDKMSQFKVILGASAAILEVHSGHEMDQGHQILGIGH